MIHLSRLARILALCVFLLGAGVALTACSAPTSSARLAEPQRLPGMPYVPAGTAQEIAKQAAQPAQAAAQPAAGQAAAAKPATGSSQASVSTQAGQPAQPAPNAQAPTPTARPTQGQTQPPAAGQAQPTAAAGQAAGQHGTAGVAIVPTVSYTLKTGLADGRMAFIGQGGDIDGKVNPTLTAKPGDTVQITLINGDGVEHDVVIEGYNVASEKVRAKGASTSIVFKADKEGKFAYYCAVPGHRAAGMEGAIVVGAAAAAPVVQGADLSQDPTEVPAPEPPGARPAKTHRVVLETIELEGQLADGTTYTFWTFNGKVPGPLLRIREGDTVEVRLKNRAGSFMAHSVDFHSVTGPGGGAAVTQTPPGMELGFTFKAINPGLYVYHCATPMVAHHIANGMYGMILVEPKEGLPKVDREFYIMQGEIYTSGTLQQKGHQEFDVEKLLDEQPTYYIFNGATNALTTKYPLKAKTGETVRIYFGVGGPNATSSFHVIGEIFDRVYNKASLTSPPLTNVQTATVAPGGATVVEFKLEVPGRFTIVDHALSRLERGLAGFLIVDGPDNPDIFKPDPNNPKTDSGGH